jgi:hypothetical protein
MIKYILLLIVTLFIKFSQYCRNICFRVGDMEHITRKLISIFVYLVFILNFLLVENIYSLTFNWPLEEPQMSANGISVNEIARGDNGFSTVSDDQANYYHAGIDFKCGTSEKCGAYESDGSVEESVDYPDISGHIERPVAVKIIDGFNGFLNVRNGPGKLFAVMTKVKVGHKFVAYEKEIKENETWYRIYLPNATGTASGWVAGLHEDCTNDTCSEEDPNSSVVLINDTYKIRTDSGTARGKEIKVTNKFWDNKNKIYRNQAINVYLWKGQQFVASEKKYEGRDADDPGNRCNTGLWYKIYLPDRDLNNKYFYQLNPNATGCPNATDCPELESSMGWICGDAVNDISEFSASLSSDPTHGVSPLTVNFIANVNGSASEYYNYYFSGKKNRYDKNTSLSSHSFIYFSLS